MSYIIYIIYMYIYIYIINIINHIHHISYIYIIYHIYDIYLYHIYTDKYLYHAYHIYIYHISNISYISHIFVLSVSLYHYLSIHILMTLQYSDVSESTLWNLGTTVEMSTFEAGKKSVKLSSAEIFLKANGVAELTNHKWPELSIAASLIYLDATCLTIFLNWWTFEPSDGSALTEPRSYKVHS